jgi:hypothetical protein
MKKVSLLVVLVFVLVGIFSTSLVSAQDEAPACAPEEISAAMESLGEVDFEGMTALPEEPTPSDFTAVVLVLDAFAYGYWEGFMEAAAEETPCAEIMYLGMQAGYVFDEMLLVSLLNALAVQEAAAGDEETANVFLEQATARQAMLEGSMEMMTPIMDAVAAGEPVELDIALPECTDEDLEAAAGMEDVIATYEEFAAGLEGATGTDLSALVAGFAELSAGYWGEFYPELPACQEISDFAFTFGIMIDETAITTGLLRLAELEGEMGDAELAQALADSAATRAEDLQAAAEEMMAEQE